MSDPFTIRIFVPKGDPEGIRIIDRINSTGTFFSFPRIEWGQIKNRQELNGAGVYILSGYNNPEDELPTLYIGQADNIMTRIEQQLKNKEFWDKAIIFVSVNKINATHAKWLEYALIKKAHDANRSILDNGNIPQEPVISEPEKADMEGFLKEIYQTLPILDLKSFEKPRPIIQSQTPSLRGEKDTIVVPAKEEGFNRVFLGENAWYAIRISGGMLEKIKYIVAYQSQPISAVTHYASILKIESYGEEGKYKLIFSESAKKLEREIPFGDTPSGSMQGPRYTNFEKLKKAKEVSDLFD